MAGWRARYSTRAGAACECAAEKRCLPEITVKTLLAGQLHQGANVWEMMSFEFIAKLAFDNSAAMVQSVSEMGSDIVYAGNGVVETDLTQFAADPNSRLDPSRSRSLSLAPPAIAPRRKRMVAVANVGHRIDAAGAAWSAALEP
jgi:hypothetical protein